MLLTNRIYRKCSIGACVFRSPHRSWIHLFRCWSSEVFARRWNWENPER